ncbi:MAG TPA: MFS transporter [Roseiarcus sp.]|nr:MFS transporter [Roseiarcus sp.]
MTALASVKGRDADFRLSLLYAATFFEMGVQIPFLPIWLGARGLSDGQIAIALAAPMALRVVATPFVAALADRRNDVAGVLTAAAIVLASSCAFLGFLSGFAPLLVAVAILLCAQGIVMPLTDALTASVLRANEDAPGGRLEYGRIRKWGSAAYIAGNLFGGLYLNVVSIDGVTIALTAAAILGVAACLYAAPLGALGRPEAHESAERVETRGLGLLPFVIATAALIQSSHALLNTFGSLHWAREGHSTAFVGSAWAIGVVCETSVFALAGRWFAGPDRAFAMLTLAGAVATLRWLVMATNPATVVLLAAQSGHGLTFAMTHLGSMHFIIDNAPARIRARAQGWFAASVAGASALVVALSGPLYAHFGEVAYLAMALLAAAGLTLTIVLAARQAALRSGAASGSQKELGASRTMLRGGPDKAAAGE